MTKVYRKILTYIKRTIFMSLIYLVIINAFVMFLPWKKQVTEKDSMQYLRTVIASYLNDKKLNNAPHGKTQVKIFRGILCNTIGEACTTNLKDGDKNYNDSIFGITSNIIAIPFSYPPASGSMWVSNGLQNIGFIPKAQAAGIGFYSFHMFMPIWGAFRNVAFTILVLIIVTIGFLIMFRAKLNPQTIISLENALPNIVLTLIFITFSYAIAGFLVDIMYVVIFLMFSIFTSSGLQPATTNALARIYLVNIGGIGLFSAMIKGFYIYYVGLNSFYNALPDLAKGLLHVAQDGLIVY